MAPVHLSCSGHLGWAYPPTDEELDQVYSLEREQSGGQTDLGQQGPWPAHRPDAQGEPGAPSGLPQPPYCVSPLTSVSPMR